METLYHYCSLDAFHSIISSSSIWLSSLSESNDHLEGRAIAKLFGELAERDELSLRQKKLLLDELHYVQTEIIDALGFCLSEQADLLSQWRAYADDGAGVCIGINQDALSDAACKGEKWSATLLKVNYEDREQLSHLETMYAFLKDQIDQFDGNEGPIINRKTSFTIDTAHRLIGYSILSGHLYTIKSYAFREEVEYRLVHSCPRSYEGCQFRVSGDRLIPYLTASFSGFETRFIDKVIVGPKCRASGLAVEAMLKSYGYKDVEVVRSAVSYR